MTYIPDSRLIELSLTELLALILTELQKQSAYLAELTDNDNEVDIHVNL